MDSNDNIPSGRPNSRPPILKDFGPDTVLGGEAGGVSRQILDALVQANAGQKAETPLPAGHIVSQDVSDLIDKMKTEHPDAKDPETACGVIVGMTRDPDTDKIDTGAVMITRDNNGQYKPVAGLDHIDKGIAAKTATHALDSKTTVSVGIRSTPCP